MAKYECLPFSLLSSTNNQQILALLSFLPIGYECLKLAFRRGHELSWLQMAHAIFPVKLARYRTLQREDVFTDPFWRDGPQIGLIACFSGLSWARPIVPNRIPLPSVKQRSLLLHPIPPATQKDVVYNTGLDKNVEEGSHSK